MDGNNSAYSRMSDRELREQQAHYHKLKLVIGSIAAVCIFLSLMMVLRSDTNGVFMFLLLASLAMGGLTVSVASMEKDVKEELAKRNGEKKELSKDEQAKRETRNDIIKGIVGLVLMIIMVVVLTTSIQSCREKDRGGDGISSCKNCGRKQKHLKIGYCDSCYESWEEWMDNPENWLYPDK